MLQRTCLVITATLATLFSVPDTDELLRVNVFPGPQHVALYVAREKGLFAKRGRNVEITFTPNAKAQRDGLADGSIDIAQAAVDNAVAMVEAGKKDVIIVAGGGNGMLNLFVRPEIKSYDDIRGKAVVVNLNRRSGDHQSHLYRCRDQPGQFACFGEQCGDWKPLHLIVIIHDETY